MTPPAAAKTGRRPRLPKGEGRQLRAEILAATEQMLLETGSSQAVSIRAVADAVGVTPPSIYRHFADKNELIFEVCARHFAALEEQIVSAAAGLTDPVERLAAMGRAYMAFGMANPEPYRIMFMTRADLAPEQFRNELLASSDSFAILMAAVQDCIDAGRIKPEYTDAYRLSLGFWARVHGLTSLFVSKPEMDWPELPGFIDEYADMCIRGVVVPGT
jgi:AcrR family transcriptional regulator